MSSLFARLKGLNDEHRILFSEGEMPDFEDFFTEPDVSAAEEYAPLLLDTLPAAWFYVELNQSQRNEMIDPYTRGIGQTPKIDQAEYAICDAVYMTSGDKIVFQRIAGADRIHENGKQHIMVGADSVQVKRVSFAIDFRGIADAMFDGQTNRVYFQSFAKAKPFFKGFDVFHQESTLEEKEMFLDNPLFDVGNFNYDSISLNDVRKIAAIRESSEFDLEDPETQQRLRQYVHNYPSAGISIGDDGRILIGGRKELSSVLKLLEQKFYTSELTGEKFVATSVKKMSK